MQKEDLCDFESFVHGFTRKSGKGLGQGTKHGILTLAKYLEPTPRGLSIESLKKLHAKYLKDRNYPMATYSLWLYLKYKGYDEKTARDIATFKRINTSAINDDEKLAASVLTKKEMIYLVEKVQNPRDKLIIRLLYDTGARISEILNAKVKDADLNTGEMQVLGKGRKPRTVYFHKATGDLLKKYLNENNISNPNALIFTIKPVTVWSNLKKYGKEYLDRGLHPHMFRHSRLQHMADEGVDSFAIKAYAGHSDIVVTQIYVKNSKFQRKLAFDKAGNIWEQS